uniref:Uncharacterized protein n=1 Tax=Rhizophora mucronata TaxID=61149 RepID=A0A2P2QJD1_RHIMU
MTRKDSCSLSQLNLILRLYYCCHCLVVPSIISIKC